MYKTLSFGEVLWDLFPDYKKPGGSPANVAYHLSQLGTISLLMSRIGEDENGDELLSFLNDKGFETRHIQRDAVHTTGVVHVKLQDDEPSYTIEEPAAWDYISPSKEVNNILNLLDAICFASLSQRNKDSKSTLYAILRALPDSCLKVFDLNLRRPYIDKKIIMKSVEQADVIKMNEDEYEILSEWYGSKNFDKKLVEKDPSKIVLKTKGEHGSSMITSGGTLKEKAYPVTGNGDFVGVGDAFLACFTFLKLQNSNPESILEKANKYAAYVASQKGGMPDIPDSLKTEIHKS